MTPLDIDSGNTAWILTSSALVLLMTPGLALFYGGMVRAKSVLNMMMMSFGALALISVLWVLWGYSLAFGDDVGYGLLGDPTQYLGLQGLMEDTGASLPPMAFSTWLIFAGIWATLVYFPIAHWVFDFSLDSHVGGWVANDLAAIDFAGGTAVHINAGIAGLALAIILGKRLGWKRDPMRPHNLTLVMLGAGLLWFGWFGFNAGSAVAASNSASVVWVNTMVATGAACLAWLLTERVRDGHATSLGAASGIVAGLVAITPSCSSVSPIGAIIVGAVAGVICALAIGLKYKFGYDDSLDVVGVHLFGGLWGTLAVGFLATAAAPAGVNGLFYGGGVDQLWRQAVGAFAVMFYSGIMTFLIGLLLHKTIGFRVSEEEERAGVDESEHAETGYDLGSFGGGRALSYAGSAPSQVEADTKNGQEVSA
jgi:ammonium transporter, Amt family